MMVSFDDLIPQQPVQRPLSRGEQKKRDADEYMKNLGAGITGAADAASFGLGDEMIAGLKSWPAYLSSGMDFKDVYAKNLEKGRADIEQKRQESPNAFLAGQIVGAIGTGVGGAATKGGAAIANSLRSGNILGYNAGLAGRAAKAGALGAATSGAAGFGAGEGLENRLDSSGDSALVGGPLSMFIPLGGAVAGKVAQGVRTIPSEIKSLLPAEPKSVADLRKAAKPLYEKFTKSGGVYSGKLTDEIADLAEAAKARGVAGVLDEADEALNKRLNYYVSLRGKKLNPSDLQALDQKFANDVGRFNKAGEYDFGRILNDLKYEMRTRAFDPMKATGYVESGSAGAVEALKEANRLYAQSYKAADIENILKKTKGTQVPQNSIRTAIKNLLANDKKMLNYTDAEKAVLEEAMNRGYVGGLMNLFGGRATDAVAGGVTGFAAGGPVGAIAGTLAGKAIGGGMNEVAGAIQANRLRGALQNIQGGANQSSKGGLPALISSPRAGQLAAPAGMVTGGQAETPVLPNAMPASLDFNDLIPQPQTAPQPVSYNREQPSLMGKIAQAESNGDPNAQNPLSSASGLYQFTDATWRSAVNKWGRKYGITQADKANPQAQEALAQELTKDNARILQAKGVEPTDGNLYFAHFMGAPAGATAIKMLGTNAIAARSFPSAAKANPTVFYKTDAKGKPIFSKPRKIEEVYELITSKVV